MRSLCRPWRATIGGRAGLVDALPVVKRAVGDRIPILVDGGVRRGVDIVKALALGASGLFDWSGLRLWARRRRRDGRCEGAQHPGAGIRHRACAARREFSERAWRAASLEAADPGACHAVEPAIRGSSGLSVAGRSALSGKRRVRGPARSDRICGVARIFWRPGSLVHDPRDSPTGRDRRSDRRARPGCGRGRLRLARGDPDSALERRFRQGTGRGSKAPCSARSTGRGGLARRRWPFSPGRIRIGRGNGRSRSSPTPFAGQPFSRKPMAWLFALSRPMRERCQACC